MEEKDEAGNLKREWARDVAAAVGGRGLSARYGVILRDCCRVGRRAKLRLRRMARGDYKSKSCALLDRWKIPKPSR